MKVVVIPIDPAENEKCEKAMARTECMILDEVKYHVIPHIVEKNTAKEMWDTLTTINHSSSVQRKMLLENQLRAYQMHKAEKMTCCRTKRLGTATTLRVRVVTLILTRSI